MPEHEVVYLSTVQLHWGGLFDFNSADGLAHLVRGTRNHTTPGPLLCGIAHHAKDAPGFSVGGGCTGPGIEHRPCPGCVEAAKRDFPGLPIAGMREQSEPFVAAVGVEAYGHSIDVPACREARGLNQREVV